MKGHKKIIEKNVKKKLKLKSTKRKISNFYCSTTAKLVFKVSELCVKNSKLPVQRVSSS